MTRQPSTFRRRDAAATLDALVAAAVVARSCSLYQTDAEARG